MEKLGIATATFVSTPFRTLAQTRRESQRAPSAQLVWVPHPMMNLLPPAIEQVATDVLPDILKAAARAGAAVEERA